MATSSRVEDAAGNAALELSRVESDVVTDLELAPCLLKSCMAGKVKARNAHVLACYNGKMSGPAACEINTVICELNGCHELESTSVGK